MGLNIDVYRNGSDSTNGGASANCKSICVVNIPGPFKPDHNKPAFKLVEGNLGTAVLKPLYEPKNMMGPCMGGNYGGTSDSRFGEAVEKILGHGFYGAIPIHDRFDTWEAYDYLSR